MFTINHQSNDMTPGGGLNSSLPINAAGKVLSGANLDALKQGHLAIARVLKNAGIDLSVVIEHLEEVYGKEIEVEDEAKSGAEVTIAAKDGGITAGALIKEFETNCLRDEFEKQRQFFLQVFDNAYSFSNSERATFLGRLKERLSAAYGMIAKIRSTPGVCCLSMAQSYRSDAEYENERRQQLIRAGWSFGKRMIWHLFEEAAQKLDWLLRVEQEELFRMVPEPALLLADDPIQVYYTEFLVWDLCDCLGRLMPEVPDHYHGEEALEPSSEEEAPLVFHVDEFLATAPLPDDGLVFNDSVFAAEEAPVENPYAAWELPSPDEIQAAEQEDEPIALEESDLLLASSIDTVTLNCSGIELIEAFADPSGDGHYQHPNRRRFRGVLFKVDEPSESIPSTGSPLPLYITAAAAEKAISKGIESLPVNTDFGLASHNQKSIVGATDTGYLSGNEFVIEGYLWPVNQEDLVALLKAKAGGQENELGMSLEAYPDKASVKVLPGGQKVFYIEDFTLTGANVLLAKKATYKTTSFLAAQAQREGSDNLSDTNDSTTEENITMDMANELYAKLSEHLEGYFAKVTGNFDKVEARLLEMQSEQIADRATLQLLASEREEKINASRQIDHEAAKSQERADLISALKSELLPEIKAAAVESIRLARNPNLQPPRQAVQASGQATPEAPSWNSRQREYIETKTQILAMEKTHSVMTPDGVLRTALIQKADYLANEIQRSGDRLPMVSGITTVA